MSTAALPGFPAGELLRAVPDLDRRGLFRAPMARASGLVTPPRAAIRASVAAPGVRR